MQMEGPAGGEARLPDRSVRAARVLVTAAPSGAGSSSRGTEQDWVNIFWFVFPIKH